MSELNLLFLDLQHEFKFLLLLLRLIFLFSQFVLRLAEFLIEFILAAVILLSLSVNRLGKLIDCVCLITIDSFLNYSQILSQHGVFSLQVFNIMPLATHLMFFQGRLDDSNYWRIVFDCFFTRAVVTIWREIWFVVVLLIFFLFFDVLDESAQSVRIGWLANESLPDLNRRRWIIDERHTRLQASPVVLARPPS